MNLIWVSLLVAGLLVSLVGSVWGLVLAFRTSIWWGLAWLFLPFAALIFFIVHFQQAKRAALTLLVGTGLLIAGITQAPQSVRGAIGQKTEEHSANQYALEQPKQQVAAPAQQIGVPAQQPPVAEGNPQAQLNECIARAQRTCAELTAKRTKTNPDDKAAVAAFNAEVIQYNALLEQIKTLQAQVKKP